MSGRKYSDVKRRNRLNRPILDSRNKLYSCDLIELNSNILKYILLNLSNSEFLRLTSICRSLRIRIEKMKDVWVSRVKILQPRFTIIDTYGIQQIEDRNITKECRRIFLTSIGIESIWEVHKIRSVCDKRGCNTDICRGHPHKRYIIPEPNWITVGIERIVKREMQQMPRLDYLHFQLKDSNRIRHDKLKYSKPRDKLIILHTKKKALPKYTKTITRAHKNIVISYSGRR